MGDTKTVTFREIFDAMERNGFTQAHDDTWIEYKGDGITIKKACAMGQAVINLGVNIVDFQYELVKFPEIRMNIITLNDSYKKNCAMIAKTMRIAYESILDESMVLRTHEYSLKGRKEKNA